MPDPRDDLVRRGDVLDMIDAESHGDEGLAIIDSRDILALPADPVAAAALALAEAPDLFVVAGYGCNAGWWECRVCGHHTYEASQDKIRHAETCAWNAYRAALAGRERGR